MSRLRSPFALAGTSFVMASAAVNISNFALHSIVSRVLGPSAYGALGSLLSVLVVLSVPLGALQAAVTQRVAEAELQGGLVDLRNLTRTTFWISSMAAVLWAACSLPMRSFLHLHGVAPVAVISLWMVPSALGAVWTGYLIGRRHFRQAAWSQLLGAGCTRLVLTALLASTSLRVTGGVLGSVLSAVAILLVLWPALPLRGPKIDATHRVALADTARSIAALGGATILTSLDTWLARHYLPATSAGYFAAAATAGRIPLFASLAVVIVVFPSLSRTEMAGLASLAHFRRALAGVGSLCALAALALTLGAPLVVATLFGSGYAGSAAPLRVIGWADAAIAVMNLFVYQCLAQRSRWAMIPWVGCVAAFVAAAAFHGSDVTLAWDMFAVNGGTLLLLSIGVFSRRRHGGSQRLEGRRGSAGTPS